MTAAENTRGLNRNQIKYLVIIAMVVDHIAWGFEGLIPLQLRCVMHFIGRLTGPTMAYFLYEGYTHTSDVKKYQKRMGIFAIISWLPFVFFERGIEGVIKNPVGLLQQSVIFTLFLGLTALRIWDSDKYKPRDKKILIAALCVVSLIGDWPVMDVLGPLFLYIYRNDKQSKIKAMCIIYGINVIMALTDFKESWYNLGVLLVPLMFMYFYNHRGGKKSKFNKWFFYIFYPAHLVILGILKWYVI